MKKNKVPTSGKEKSETDTMTIFPYSRFGKADIIKIVSVSATTVVW